MSFSNNTDVLWQQIRAEALAPLEQEPLLTPLMLSAIVDRHSLPEALAHRLAHRLAAADFPAAPLLDLFSRLLTDHPDIVGALASDINAVLERDPAVHQASEVLLYMKGVHALTTHRFAHALWKQRRHHLARYLQHRSSEVFQTDIHPAACLGCGIFVDHATGVVIGETAVIEDDVTLLHSVTLGGTGAHTGDRHPKVRRGAFIGADAKLLGNIEIGEAARIGAGSVVLTEIPPHATAVGIPAKIVSRDTGDTPHHSGR
ncbi:serine O-acetyltransferase [Carnimonas nigrificans]|uniref:serine O-acetyltransferase n=1 Tax=Carnimonas nigrificans TaxID=64323 RepID=UPI00046F3654|nr:serine O-acetyltransferase [Carnimonas nigrificans]